MTMRMLIDARHREETRVAVVKGSRIEEFDFESAEHKQLKGNIYLAKVTRVEPSLQAAFIDYGGNRHGFLAFSEIHPDYYQIPKEDRDALLREEAEHVAEEAALRAEQDAADDLRADDEDDDGRDDDADDDGAGHDRDDMDHEDRADGHEAEEGLGEGDVGAPEGAEDGAAAESGRRSGRRRGGSDDAVEDLRERRMNLRRRYKIQDVIRRRQVLLVQVVKEERGNKGAALTTYLSLAGRYCVLMPNTSHGGGISRKISNAGDRKRLKSIMADMKLPPSMGCIVRTAGLQRTRVEIRRDFDYLARLWDGIRETTLASSAPALVYGDSDLIKRAIRDIYNRDIDEVIIEGEEGYRQARDFMKLLMPSHARRVKHYSDAVPLFQRSHVEDQLAAMYQPVVQLKSGGYLVINPTEALVSIDINSGRSTREHNIEQTATATNLEAAAEIARQLRLRDMAGLVVIDFIDMDNGSNVRKVEKAMKEALKNDRARIQVGRISSFGLMEMSRQRLRTGVLEASTRQCPHCEGTGLVRTASSAGLSALRLIEDEAAQGRGSQILLRASQEAAFYLLNRKRFELAEIEDRYGVVIEVAPDGDREGARMAVEVSGPPPAHAPRFEAAIQDIDDDLPDDVEDEIDAVEDDEVGSDPVEAPRAPREPRPERVAAADSDEGDGDARRRRRRRRGRRGRSRPDGEEIAGTDEGDAGSDDAGDAEDDGQFEGEATDPTAHADASGGSIAVAEAGSAEPDAGDAPRRRGRRGRRSRRSDGEVIATEAGPMIDADLPDTSEQPTLAAETTDGGSAVDAAPPAVDVEPTGEPAGIAESPAAGDDAPKPARRRPRARAAEEDTPPVAAKRPRRAKAAEAVTTDTSVGGPPDLAEDQAGPRRRAPRRRAAAQVVAEGGEQAQSAVVEVDLPPADASGATAEQIGALVATGAVPMPLAGGAAPADAAVSAQPPEDRRPAAAIDEGQVTAGEIDPDPGEAGSPRRGWWQRTFGA